MATEGCCNLLLDFVRFESSMPAVYRCPYKTLNRLPLSPAEQLSSAMALQVQWSVRRGGEGGPASLRSTRA